MREGKNPIRDQRLENKECNHVIIVPFFISNKEEYFSGTLDILKLCLKSLRLNSCYDSQIHLVANGYRSIAIEKELIELHHQSTIDHLSIISKPVGKVNAILSVLRNVRSSFVTITDADVLFLPQWDKEVFTVFKNFKKAAAVSPVPVFRTHNRLTSNIWADYLFSNKLSFSDVEDPEAMTQYAKSIGWPWLDKKYKTKYMTLTASNGDKAVVGNGHFCVTYNTSIFKALPYENADFILGGNSENKYLDEPAVLCDGYRLATLSNNAYHMGNKPEPWMSDLLNSFLPLEKEDFTILNHKFRPRKLTYKIKIKLFKNLLSRFKLLYVFYRAKGLSKNDIEFIK